MFAQQNQGLVQYKARLFYQNNTISKKYDSHTIQDLVFLFIDAEILSIFFTFSYKNQRHALYEQLNQGLVQYKV